MKHIFTRLDNSFLITKTSLLVLVLFTNLVAVAAEFESNGSNTDWDDATSWDLVAGSDADGIPDSGDSVKILDGDTIIVDANGQCEYLKIESSGGATVFTVNSGVELDVLEQCQPWATGNNAIIKMNIDGRLDVLGQFYVFSAYTGTDVDINISGTGTFNAFDTGTNRIQFLKDASGSSLNVDGHFHVFGKMWFQLYSHTSFDLTIGGDMEVENEFRSNPRGINGSMAIEIDGGLLNCDGNLVLQASHSALASNNIVDLRFAGARLELGNSLTLSGVGGQVISDAANNSTVAYDGANQTILVDSDVTYNNLEIGGSGTKTLSTNILATSLLGDVTVNLGATLSDGGFSMGISGDLDVDGTFNGSGSLDVNGGIDIAGTFTSTGCDINVAGDWANSGTYTASSGDNVTFDGSALQQITGTTTFEILTLANTLGGATDVEFPSGTHTIDSILDINDCAVNNSGGTVILASTGSGSANMADIGTGSYTGNLQVNRQIACTNQGFREMTSPVQATVLDNWEDDGIIMAGFTNSDFPGFSWVSAYDYLESAASGVKNDGWQDADDASTETTDDGKGWRVYMDASTFNASVSGTPTTGDISVSVTNTLNLPASDQDGWNLIGNPYPCAINWNALAAADKADVDDIIYTWNSTAGNYGTYTGGAASGTNDVDSVIAHSQAFWVHATVAAGTVDFKESHKILRDKAYVKSLETPSNFLKIRMSASASTYFDEAILRVVDGASDQYDAAFDHFKLYSEIMDEVPSLAFVTSDGHDLTYNSVDGESSSIELKAFAGSLAQGTYTLDFQNLEKFAPDACITLEDLETGITQDLRTNSTYTYSTTSSDDTSARFIIHIAVQYETVSTDATCSYESDGIIEIMHNSLSAYALTWFDDSGNLVGTDFATSANYSINSLAPGSYELEIEGACKTFNELVEITAPQEVVANFNCCVSAETNELLPLANTSTGAAAYVWDMGDGTLYNDVVPVHAYSNAGNYTITLTAYNDFTGTCEDVKTFDVEITSASVGINEISDFGKVYASNSMLYIQNTHGVSLTGVQLLDMTGKIVLNESLNTSGNSQIPVGRIASGTYIIKVSSNEGTVSTKVSL